MNQEMLTHYFNRIGLPKDTALTIENLKMIHRAQHRTIPFENIDIVNGQSIQLADEVIYEKLVNNKRGGYCHELNGLLFIVLNALGFEARVLLGRVHLSPEPTGRGHRVTLVMFNGQQWLVDAGFGTFTPREPLPIEFDKELVTDLQVFRFLRDEDYGVLLQVKESDEWLSLYSLDMGYVCKGDLEYANHFSSTHPDSAFTSGVIAALSTVEGINTLSNQQLKIKKNGVIQQIILEDETSYFKALKDYFGLEPNLSYKKIEQHF
ncbi:arylamine N-acetyltransferase family protein [Aliivibrio fischeri]|uniref:arylamine N-acetyltransferase family protein n=1 Tax=Aliivibrio fischeri TaxID=668 RepID=UPI001F370124|nr:arylamine N-acetyltransferase [Aliivibrio fischeri]MCE7553989.1 arylamine N-acetyltransferase [Aliivibrio fischeri]MCE7561159.1 arylamine N-acetyltransferase [Aliivibrio fischeri]MCE7568567.1 arylamine N-acetyltransferase [Aliivibrio fischeri]